MIETIIDISHWQGTVDFDKVKSAGIQAVILKCIQGSGTPDIMYRVNYDKAAKAGLLIGSYHFGTGADTGEVQASLFLARAQTGVLALDLENNSSGEIMTFVQANEFVETVHDRVNVWPLLYSGNLIKAYAAKYPDMTSPLFHCPLWLAQYSDKYTLPLGFQSYTLWQFTDKGKVDGIVGNCDVSRYMGERDELESFWRSNTVQILKPPTDPPGTL